MLILIYGSHMKHLINSCHTPTDFLVLTQFNPNTINLKDGKV